MDREPLLRAVPLDQARPMALRRPGHRRLPDTLVLDPHPPPPAGQGRRVPRRPGPGLLLAAAPTTPNATGHTDSTSTRALHPPTPTGTCLSRMRGRLARPVCAVRRFVVSPTQSGGTGKEVPGSPGSPGRESRRGPQHAGEAVAVPGVWGGVPQGPRDMAKAGLLEAQSPAVRVLTCRNDA